MSIINLSLKYYAELYIYTNVFIIKNFKSFMA